MSHHVDSRYRKISDGLESQPFCLQDIINRLYTPDVVAVVLLCFGLFPELLIGHKNFTQNANMT